MRRLLALITAITFLFIANTVLATGGGKALLYGGAGQGKVIFDGRVHASKGFVCKDCHGGIFDTHKKALITMDDHSKPKACFVCHNGTKAFAECDQCHRKFSSAEAVIINGAASVVTDLVTPHKATVEKTTGYKLIVNKSNAGKGLIDLIDGKCDAAMASAELDATIKAAQSAGLTKPVPDLKMHVIAKSEVVFIVHPSNPVKNLSWEQIKDIHIGKITNWKEIGGKDLPITVYTDAKASATRGLIKQTVLANAEYADNAKAVDAVKQVNDKVAQDESGIGGLGIGFVDPGKVSIITTKKLERPLGFITVGAPSAKVQKIMDAFTAASK